MAKSTGVYLAQYNYNIVFPACVFNDFQYSSIHLSPPNRLATGDKMLLFLCSGTLIEAEMLIFFAVLINLSYRRHWRLGGGALCPDLCVSGPGAAPSDGPGCACPPCCRPWRRGCWDAAAGSGLYLWGGREGGG